MCLYYITVYCIMYIYIMYYGYVAVAVAVRRDADVRA